MKLKIITKEKKDYGLLFLIPLLLMLIARIYSFSSPSDSDLVAPIERTLILLLAYAIAFVNVFRKGPVGLSLFVIVSPLFLEGFYACLISIFSDEIFTSINRGIHLFGLGLVAISTGIWANSQNFKRDIISILFWLFSILSIFSLVFVIFLPQYGLIDPNLSIIQSRWNGITTNPNWLGMVAFVSIWVCLAWMSRTSFSKGHIIAIGILFLNVILLIGSDSRTSMISSILLFVGFYLFHGKSVISSSAVIRKSIILLLLGTIFSIFFYFIFTEFIENITKTRQGAENALSGRPQIWLMGVEAFLNRPLGWGYDNLATYWNNGHQYFERFTHFHNGFLDVAVKGGIFALLMLVIVLIRMGNTFFKLKSIDPNLSRSLIIFFFVNIIYNSTETAYGRETVLWVFLVSLWGYAEGRIYKPKDPIVKNRL